MPRQRTIEAPVHAIGVGVHTGNIARITLRPAPVDTGIEFTRTDTPQRRPIKARAENVCDTTLATSIGMEGVQIATVEHLLSALWGLGIDNLHVDLHGEEVPIMDGSAQPFIDLVNSVGIREQDSARRYILITRDVRVSHGDAVATLSPYDGFKAGYTFVFDHPVYNRYPKHAELDFADISYVDDVSGARSFGLARELAQAQAIKRCLGSSLANAVGIDDHGIINDEGLRYPDEFVKHKILDAIGDLYLLGLPLIGAFEGYMSGHALNNTLAMALLRCTDAWTLVESDDAAALGAARRTAQLN